MDISTKDSTDFREDLGKIDQWCVFPPALSINQAAQLLGVGHTAIRKMIENQEIPAVMFGKGYRISKQLLWEIIVMHSYLAVADEFHKLYSVFSDSYSTDSKLVA